VVVVVVDDWLLLHRRRRRQRGSGGIGGLWKARTLQGRSSSRGRSANCGGRLLRRAMISIDVWLAAVVCVWLVGWLVDRSIE